MKKDIENRKVEGIAIALVPRENDVAFNDLDFLDAYLINLKEETVKGIFISSRGYGKQDNEEIRTATFRHFFEVIESQDFLRIEPIERKVFDLTNEFWISFRHDGFLYEKKFIFVPGSIHPDNLTSVPFMGIKGILIK